MTVLEREISNDVNIQSALQVLEYENDTDRDMTVLCKAQLGSIASPVVGGGLYSLFVFIDDVEVLPQSSITITDQTTAVVQSRQIQLGQGQTIRIECLGRAGDSAVDLDVVLLDVTPAALSDIYGAGLIPVDHNTGGTDTYRTVDVNSAAIPDVKISAYLTSDYVAGNRGGAFLKGRTQTGVDGRWRTPLSLEAGAYTLVFAKPPHFNSDTRTLTVA